MQPNLDGNDWPCNMFWRPRKFSVRVPGGANCRGSLTSFSGTQNGRGSVKEKSYALQLCVLQLTPPDWLQPTNCVSCFSLVVPGYSLLHTFDSMIELYWDRKYSWLQNSKLARFALISYFTSLSTTKKSKSPWTQRSSIWYNYKWSKNSSQKLSCFYLI